MESVAETIEGYAKDVENIIVNTYSKGGTRNETKIESKRALTFFLFHS